jgi:hypothetical protein
MLPPANPSSIVGDFTALPPTSDLAMSALSGDGYVCGKPYGRSIYWLSPFSIPSLSEPPARGGKEDVIQKVWISYHFLDSTAKREGFECVGDKQACIAALKGPRRLQRRQPSNLG